jgi:hypothetical protein
MWRPMPDVAYCESVARRVWASGRRPAHKEGRMRQDLGLQVWLAPVRNTVWVAAHFGHR